MRIPIAIVCLLGAIAAAQESQPESRRERWQFRKVDRAPDVSSRSVLARVDDQGDAITVFTDGFAYYTIEKTYHSDMVGESPETRRQHWVAQLPRTVIVRVQDAVAASAKNGSALGREQLLDLTRFPRDERRKTIPHMTGREWAVRHQEDDGSWSTGDLEFQCDEDNPPLCTGRGRGRFQVAGTALITLNYLGAGYGPSRPGPYLSVVRSALGWVLSRQQSHGGFRASRDPVTAMTNACTTIALCRTLVSWREADSFTTEGPASRSWSREQVRGAAAAGLRWVREDQGIDGSWGDDSAESRRISTTVWGLLALQAGRTAGMEVEREPTRRGVASIEKQVAAVEAVPASDPITLARARASRALGRRLGGAHHETSEDLTKLAKEIELAGPSARDAETILFGTLAAADAEGSLRDRWMEAVGSLIVGTQAKDGCAEGSYAVPTVWWEEGGRVVSTALMTWAMEARYRYPYALWLN